VWMERRQGCQKLALSANADARKLGAEVLAYEDVQHDCDRDSDAGENPLAPEDSAGPSRKGATTTSKRSRVAHSLAMSTT